MMFFATHKQARARSIHGPIVDRGADYAGRFRWGAQILPMKA